MKNKLFVISGPSGVGKGTLVKEILKDDPRLRLSVSCTTRLPREGEADGREYFFITRAEFENRIHENDFLEYDEHFGNYYGTPRSFVERQLKDHSIILEIDVVGGLNAKRMMPDETVLIMIVPPSEEELVHRLKTRGAETEEQIHDRLIRVRYELSHSDLYDYIIVNDDLKTAKEQLALAIDKEICRKGDKI